MNSSDPHSGIHRAFVTIFVAAAAIGAWPATAGAGRPSRRPVTLEQLVRDSDLVLRVRRAKPFATSARVKVPLPGRRGKRRVAVDRRTVYRFTVLEVLHSRSLVPKKWIPALSRIVKVEQAFALRRFLHGQGLARTRGRGHGRSMILARYGATTRGQLPAAAESIIFVLCRPTRKDTLAFVVDGAFEDLAARPRVLAAIAKISRAAAARPGAR